MTKPLCEITSIDLGRWREQELNVYLKSLDREPEFEEEEKGGDDE